MSAIYLVTHRHVDRLYHILRLSARVSTGGTVDRVRHLQRAGRTRLVTRAERRGEVFTNTNTDILWIDVHEQLDRLEEGLGLAGESFQPSLEGVH